MEYASTGVWQNHAKSSDRNPVMAMSNRAMELDESSSSRKLDFDQAMQDFQTMFPTADPEVIESVLRANKGAVEKTIDDLLAVCVERDEPSSAAWKEPPTQVSDKPPPVPRRPSAVKKIPRWNPPLVGPLPEDFLRITTAPVTRMQFHKDPEPRRSLLNVGQVIRGSRKSDAKPTKSKTVPAALSSSPENGIDDYNEIHLRQKEYLNKQSEEEDGGVIRADGKPQPGWDNDAFSSHVDGGTAASPASGARAAEDPVDPKSKVKKSAGIVSKQRLNSLAKQFSLGKKKAAKAATKSTAYDHLIEDNNSLVSDDDEDGHIAEGSAHVRLDRKSSQGAERF